MATKMKMRAVFDCSADDAGELSFKEGDILVDVVNSGEDGWYSGRLENSSTIGLFPYNYVERITEPTEPIKVELVKSPEPILPSSNINIPTTSAKPTWTAGNKLTQSRSVNDNTNLPGFPALDAFEAAMSTGKGSKPTSNNWNANNFSPPIISPKPKLTTSFNINQDSGIKPTAPTISEKPQLKSFELKGEASPTRLRSYSTSSVANKDESNDKTIKPSQLLNGKNTKSALELALSKGSPSTRVQSKLRSNSLTKPSNSGSFVGGGVPLIGMVNLKLNNPTSNDVEEEDGYQMIKPSQLRQRQQQSSSPKPIISKSSAPTSSFSKPTTTATSWKNTINNNNSNKSNILSSSPKKSTSLKLEDVPTSTSPMPRLPSRPVSNASRRSRNSRSTSLNSSPSTSANTTPISSSASLPPVKETSSEKGGPPILKPKPVISHPNLPPRPNNKSRSSSNPPPLQPKPTTMSSIEILLSKNGSAPNEKKQSSETKTPPRVAPNKPSIPLTQPKQQSNKSNFIPSGNKQNSNLDNWKTPSTESNNSTDVNVKPSALLNRSRSSTNPTSNTDWSNEMTKRSNNNSSLTENNSNAIVKSEPKKKTTPPPPPPSRPPKNSNKANYIMDEVSRHRYEILFDTIHDDGFVDGETARFIWLKSKLSSEELSRIWKECDPDHKGLLDKHAFIDGMGRIDELLMNKQQVVL